MEKKHDIIVAGGGLAALVLAARLTELGVKDIGIYALSYGATPYIAAINFVLPDSPFGDTPEQYCEDMMSAGYATANRQMVEDMCRASSGCYELLKRWGVKFSLMENGSPRLRKTSGSSLPRSLCSIEHLIGEDIIDVLVKGLKEKGVIINSGYEVLQLLKNNGGICGITVRDPDGATFNVHSSTVVAAWGGVGGILGHTTYPGDITGKLFSEAFEAGAQLTDMEFLEFEPMIVIDPAKAYGEPCPTAMLGEGAYLLNADMERFILKCRPQGESGSPKTLLNKAIWNEIKLGKGSPHGGVYVDMRHIPENTLKMYPWFYNRLKEAGKNPAGELIEVKPMPHSISGGIAVDRNYRSNINGLYAIGEAAGSIHGACRIGGNASSQAAISGMLCAEAIAKLDFISDVKPQAFEYAQDSETDKAYTRQIQALGDEALGAYRCRGTMEKNARILSKLLLSGELNKDKATRQRALTILIMIKAALAREESRGVHLRTDFPLTNPLFERGLILRQGPDGLPEVMT